MYIRRFSSPLDKSLSQHGDFDLGDNCSMHKGLLAPPSESEKRDATAVARSQMKPHEADAWDHYLRGSIKLPVIDWARNRGQAATGKRSQQKRRAEALNRLYNVRCAEVSHAAWIPSNLPALLPLVKAMARVIGAERQYGSRSDIDVVTPLACIQDLNKSISSLTQRRRRYISDVSLPKQQMDARISSLIDQRRRVRQQRLADRVIAEPASQRSTTPSVDTNTVTEAVFHPRPSSVNDGTELSSWPLNSSLA
jgi:hypothetical protein